MPQEPTVPDEPLPERLVRSDVAAKSVNRSDSAVKNWIRAGKIRSWKSMAAVMVDLDEVEALVAPRPQVRGSVSA